MHRSNFLELVAKERTRQIVEKGYTREHDDEHTDGSLADAASFYAMTYHEIPVVYCSVDNDPLGLRGDYVKIYKWHPIFNTKKKHSRKEQLIIAAALINAEYDRIVREEQKDTRCRGCNYLLSDDSGTWCALTGMPMDEYDARCEHYCLPPFETSEDNPLLKSFNRSSYE